MRTGTAIEPHDDRDHCRIDIARGLGLNCPRTTARRAVKTQNTPADVDALIPYRYRDERLAA